MKRTGQLYIPLLLSGLLSWLSASTVTVAQVDQVAPPAQYADAAESLARFISDEIEQKSIPAFSIAVVSGQDVVFARGFGYADRERTQPATASTIYRVGSVSKLLSDIAVVHLIDEGRIELDADIRDVLPDFQPENPFDQPITLRHLMSHTSGLVREPPVGNYFDPSTPSLSDTVHSLNSTRLLHRPGSKTKYSNAAVSVAGLALQETVDRPFADYMQEASLAPLQMDSSSYRQTDQLAARMAAADMWSYDGRRFPAPDLQMGAIPAGNLYSTVLDLSQFMRLIFNDGQWQGRQMLTPTMLKEMLAPPSDQDAQGRSFGIGFALGDFEGHPTFQHGGAIYGFSTQFIGLKNEKLGVIAVASLDVSNGFVEHVAEQALGLFLAARSQQPLPAVESTRPVDRGWARRAAGLYADRGQTRRLIELDGKLRLQGGTYDHEIRQTDEGFVIDDVQAFGPAVEVTGDELVIGDRRWQRIDDALPAEPAAPWRGLIGEYGWDHNTLFIYEKQGRLWTLIEWVFHYPLTELEDNVFAFPDYGLYAGERLYFQRDDNQSIGTAVVAAEVNFPRRDQGLDVLTTFKIRPLLSGERLREIALAAQPPDEPDRVAEPELVDLTTLDDSIQLDIRYAGENNFMGMRFYDQPRAFLQRPAAESLVEAQRKLEPQGFGLLIHDAYRPWYVTRMFWDATPIEMKHFVANPDQGSRHNRGCAVDLTLYDLQTGEPIPMVSGYDEFSERAYPEYPGGTDRARWHRRLLRRTMEDAGFDVYQFEWWHFDYYRWRDYPISNLSFEQIPNE